MLSYLITCSYCAWVRSASLEFILWRIWGFLMFSPSTLAWKSRMACMRASWYRSLRRSLQTASYTRAAWAALPSSHVKKSCTQTHHVAFPFCKKSDECVLFSNAVR